MDFDFDFFTCLLLFCFTSVFILILHFKATNTAIVANVKLPPGPKPLPIIGNLLDLSDKPHRSLAKLAKSHGPIMTLKLGQITSIVVSSPAMAKEVLQTHDQFLSDRTVPDVLTTHNHKELGLPWIPTSTLWRKLRRICNNQLFSGKILDAGENLRRKKVDELVGSISKSALNGEAVDLCRASFVTTLNVLSNMIFSEDLSDLNSELAKGFRESFHGLTEVSGKPNLGDYFPLLKKFDIQGLKRKGSFHFENILNFLREIIDQRHKISDSVSYNDMLHHILNDSHESSDMKIGNIELQHLVLVLFVAGTDTTSGTIQWAMAELMKNPEKLSKGQEEIRRVIGKGNQFEESDISRLPYLQAIVKETFRLHPVAPLLLPRKAKQEVEIGGYTIPKDAQVVINAWAIGRDESVWENPEWFEPERFMGSEIDVRGRNFELIPFGGGRRICPGLPLAMRLLHMILGSLLHFFDWKLEDGYQPQDLNMEEKFGITIEMAFPLRALPLLV